MSPLFEMYFVLSRKKVQKSLKMLLERLGAQHKNNIYLISKSTILKNLYSFLSRNFPHLQQY